MEKQITIKFDLVHYGKCVERQRHRKTILTSDKQHVGRKGMTVVTNLKITPTKMKTEWTRYNTAGE